MATAIDPVCGMTVEIETAKFSHEHEGTTYYFCGTRAEALSVRPPPSATASRGP